jgi:hypothetical protein
MFSGLKSFIQASKDTVDANMKVSQLVDVK